MRKSIHLSVHVMLAIQRDANLEVKSKFMAYGLSLGLSKKHGTSLSLKCYILLEKKFNDLF